MKVKIIKHKKIENADDNKLSLDLYENGLLTIETFNKEGRFQNCFIFNSSEKDELIKFLIDKED
jgi:hypothetical protein